MGDGGRFDAREVKRRLPLATLLANDGVELRRNGSLMVGCCPFHEERSPSFTVYQYPDPADDHAHCFGCGWNGDIFSYWQAKRGGGFADALAALASLAACPPSSLSVGKKQAAQVPRVTAGRKEKPTLPRLRALTEPETVALAALRGLDAGGIAAAAAAKRVGGCMWPQWLGRDGTWRVADGATPCWVVTDGERAVAQFRRLDGLPFVRADGKEIKAWTKGSPTWPVGAAEMGDRAAVLLVEGGADMLAAFHFLARFGRLDRVAVVAMLGASMRIAEDALGFFARKRVRIIMDEDEPKGERGLRPGLEAAARWTGQLAGAGAAVETFSLAGLLRKDGGAVKDLNDLADADEAAWSDPELRAAFWDFDF
jgi:hypothetical protein